MKLCCDVWARLRQVYATVGEPNGLVPTETTSLWLQTEKTKLYGSSTATKWTKIETQRLRAAA